MQPYGRYEICRLGAFHLLEDSARATKSFKESDCSSSLFVSRHCWTQVWLVRETSFWDKPRLQWNKNLRIIGHIGLLPDKAVHRKASKPIDLTQLTERLSKLHVNLQKLIADALKKAKKLARSW